jgi:hypothetical protein
MRLIVIVISILLSLILVLLFDFLYSHLNKTPKTDHYLLFSKINKSGEVNSNIFNKADKFYIYEKNSKIRHVKFYIEKGGGKSIFKQYDYIINTNNFGLSQDNHILPNVDSILILGDSFTEGQGYIPWFNNFTNNFEDSKFQFINGGILGAGFQTFEALLNFLLSRDIKIEYLVIIFIGNDYERPILTFSDFEINCLKFYKECRGNEIFYGYPLNDDINDFLRKITELRENNSFNKNNYFPYSNRIYSYLKLNFLETKDIKASRKTLNNFTSKFDEKLLFIHVTDKNESSRGKKSFMSSKAINDIKKKGGKISECKLTHSDFLINDGHPNKEGYKKIADCVAFNIKKEFNLSSY